MGRRGFPLLLLLLSDRCVGCFYCGTVTVAVAVAVKPLMVSAHRKRALDGGSGQSGPVG